jgi:hypothetical protein
LIDLRPEVLGQHFERHALFPAQLTFADAQLQRDGVTSQLANVLKMEQIVHSPGA